MPTNTHTHTPSIERDRGSPDFPPTEADLDGRIPDLDSLLVTDSEGEEDPAPAEEHPVDTLHEAVATACVVLGTSLSELWGHQPDKWKPTVESLYRRQARVQHPDRNRDNAREAHQKTIQLGIHRDTLFQFIESWQMIRRLLGKHTPTCVCARCYDLWTRMSRCTFCLGTNTKNGHQGCGLGKDASYYRRYRLAWFPTLVRHQAHGCTTQQAKQNAERERLLQERRRNTEAKLDKLREQQAAQEAQILFDQELAEALQKAELEVTAKWEQATGLSAGASSLKASFCAVGLSR